MGSIFHFFFLSWGIILQVLAIVHFIRRRPDTWWIFVILFGGALGAIIYLLIEAVPDLGLLKQSFKTFPRRSRIRELQSAVLDNPSSGNYEELADLHRDEGHYARARECYNRAITPRTDYPDPFYHRALCSMELGDPASAIPDLERVIAQDPKHGYYRAQGLLAHAYALTGQTQRAAELFAKVTQVSTLSETQYNYALFLASQHREAEARQWAQRILNKKPTMPRFLKRQERPWFRRASGLLRRLPEPPFHHRGTEAQRKAIDE